MSRGGSKGCWETMKEEPLHTRKNDRGEPVGVAVLNLKGLVLFCAFNATRRNKPPPPV